MSLQTLGMIAVAALCAGMAWTAAKYFYTAYRLRQGTTMIGQIRLPDEPMPEVLVGIDQTINRLGFEPRLTMQRDLVGARTPVKSRIYVHPAYNIELALTEQQTDPPFSLSLETTFADGALLMTTYPSGYSVATEQISVRFAAYSLQEAFDHHLLTQLSWMEAHGDTRLIPTVDAAYFAYNTALVKQHGRALYRPIIRQYFGAGIAMIGYIFIVLGLASQVLAGDSFFNFNFLTATTLAFLLGLALAVGGNGWANRGKTLPAVDADKAPVIDPKMHPLNRPVRMS
jgi:hypothetical protein